MVKRQLNLFHIMIMLSAKSEEDDKLNVFEIGLDDYVTKSFSPKELMAIVKAVLKKI